MLKWSLALIALSLATPLMAQDEKDDAQLFPSSGYDTSYLGLVYHGSGVSDAKTPFVGVQGAIEVHPYLRLGAGVFGLTGRYQPDVENSEKLSASYYGLLAESRVYSWKFLTLAVSVLVGTGQVSYKVIDGSNAAVWEKVGFSVMQPGASLLVHLTERADVALGYAMRSIGEFELAGVDSADFGGGVITVGLYGNL